MVRKEQRNKTTHIPNKQLPCRLQMPLFSNSGHSLFPITTSGCFMRLKPKNSFPSNTPLHFSRAASMEGLAHVRAPPIYTWDTVGVILYNSVTHHSIANNKSTQQLITGNLLSYDVVEYQRVLQ